MAGVHVRVLRLAVGGAPTGRGCARVNSYGVVVKLLLSWPLPCGELSLFEVACLLNHFSAERSDEEQWTGLSDSNGSPVPR